jgi:hypothetical protein
MSKESFREAIETLEEDLKGLYLEVKKKKLVINGLYESLGEAAPYQLDDDSKILHRDEFYAKPFATAASEFLKFKEHACTAEEILHGLEEGGFEFPWPEKDRLRTVAVSLGKNTTVFRKLPNSTYGLTDWYTNKPMKRTKFPETKSDNNEKTEDLGRKEQEEDIKFLMQGE